MEQLLGGFQLPFQRRLTKLYTDTKSSYEFVKESVQAIEDPDLAALQRRLRIQKDRLISWGLEWSDSSKSADIDESLSRAGLGEVVESVMSTIKEMLAEAEYLWKASKRPYENRGEKSEKSGESKLSMVVWDRNRFEELIRDLTISIDTLHDLSRTRQNIRQAPTMKYSSSNVSFSTKVAQAEQARLFESTRMKTPQQIDPSCLVDPRNPDFARDYPDLAGTFLSGETSSRRIVYFRRSSAAGRQSKTNEPVPLLPVLLEYAAYDPIYASTGIPPEMDRFEKLFAGLQTTAQGLASGPDFGLLPLIGYFEDTVQAQFGLLYKLPSRLGTWDTRGDQSVVPQLTTLADILSNQAQEPPLEVKFRLARNVASSILDLHLKGIVHGDITTNNICFVESRSKDIAFGLSSVNLRRPFITSFDLFPENAHQSISNDYLTEAQRAYHHPSDPRISPYTKLSSDSRSLDLYSLGRILQEIGLWRSISNDLQGRSIEDVDWNPYYKQLAMRCGNLYSRTVQACFKAADDEVANVSDFRESLPTLYDQLSTSLERCCAIDDEVEDVSGQSTVPIRASKQHDLPASPFIDLGQTVEADEVKTKKEVPSQRTPKQVLDETPTNLQPIRAKATRSQEKGAMVPKATLRLFPAVEMEQYHWDVWNKVLMPAINKALRGFYRKYPESVEISLERIGETAYSTKPTILIVCTSVGKVRSILKKHFSYDSSIYGLMVCRGKVFRSRKNQSRRSAASDAAGYLQTPENPSYQERPLNGASIGAYVEGQHLPPVSFGGLVMVGNKPYGLTVHHMLDDPAVQDQFTMLQEPETKFDIPPLDSEDEPRSDEDGYAVSEHGSDYSEASSDGDYSDADDEDVFQAQDAGDIEGIPEGCGAGYGITQPALDDVDEGFYPDEETVDQDHLDTYGLGEIYASSGIRRRNQDGIAHEIDWALFEFDEQRRPSSNYIKGGEQHCHAREMYPVEIAPWSSLHGLEIHCSGRTTGLQKGRILPGMTIVKIFGRQTPSQSYQVSGKLGIPGDSGAWVIDNAKGRACGHILAWSSRKQVAYICPMEIILADIADTLEAEVSLPSSKVPKIRDANEHNELTGGESSSNAELISSWTKEPRIENTKHLASMGYSQKSNDELVDAMHGMHVSHSLVSQS